MIVAPALRSYLGRIPVVAGSVFGNRELRRVEAALAGFCAAEWAVWLAMIVYAYERGGATLAGVVAVVQLVPAAIFAPFASTLGDRYRAGRVLLAGYLAQAAAMGLTAAVILADAPAPIAYAFAAVASTAVTITRPSQAALVPSLARRPEELTAANVVSGWIESVCLLVAPALTGVLLGAYGAGSVFAVMAVVILGSAVLVAPVPGPPPAGSEGTRVAFTDTLAGLRVLRSDPAIRSLMLLLSVGAVALGALDVLYAELAIGVLDKGPSWAGYLNAAFGVGATLGIVVTVLLVGRPRLMPAIVLSLLAWSAAFAAIGLHATIVIALVMLGVVGGVRAVFDVAGQTLLQRASSADVLARMFGLLEGLGMAGVAVGAMLAPLLIAIGGARLALVGVAVLLPLTVLAGGRSLLRIDRQADVPVVQIGLLRSLPLFAPLGAASLEALARSLVPVDADPGDTVIREGDPGDRFYVIAAGTVRVEGDGEDVGRLRRGDGFGEIALLHDKPRTASCIAVEPTHLYALERDDFLEAVTGHPQVGEEASRLADARLTADETARQPGRVP
jgi:MFS family permease